MGKPGNSDCIDTVVDSEDHTLTVQGNPHMDRDMVRYYVGSATPELTEALVSSLGDNHHPLVDHGWTFDNPCHGAGILHLCCSLRIDTCPC